MENNNIIKLRKKLDLLDNKFLNLIKKRSILINKILEEKTSKNQIVDRKRIKIILNQIRKKSVRNKIDPMITNKIWKNMILAYIDYERRNFKKK